MLGLAIGRIGCFLNGCCYGGVCALPWAVAFPQQSPPFERQMNRADAAGNQLFLHGMAFSDQAAGLGGPAVIDKVQPGSAAARAGLQANEQILEIDRQSATDAKPVQVFPSKRREGPGEGTVSQDDSLSAAEMALLSVSGEGTRIIVRTEQQMPSRCNGKSRPPTSRRKKACRCIRRSFIVRSMHCYYVSCCWPTSHFGGTTARRWRCSFILHPLARFLVEAIRTDEPKQYFGMSISQVGSLVFVAAALGLWFYLRRQPVNTGAVARRGANGDGVECVAEFVRIPSPPLLPEPEFSRIRLRGSRASDSRIRI